MDYQESSSKQSKNEFIGLDEQKLLELAQSKPKGFSDKDITASLPNLNPSQTAELINKLLSQGNIELFTSGVNKTLLYKLKDPTKERFAKGSDNEEKIVYSIIEEAGNKGIWIRDIRFKSNLNQISLNKILKSLENKKIIKSIKSVAAGKKKVYMLYDLQPDRSITGGAWYQDQDFEVEFVDVLNDFCYKYLQKQKAKMADCKNGPLLSRNVSYVSSTDVWKHITDLHISKVDLTVEDLEMILNTLVYDGKAEKLVTNDRTNMYRAVESLLDFPGLIGSPCGVCPVRKNCCDEGEITPSKCLYFTQWLEF
ncbi:DNA-directed RNA polymerase III subunit RPC6 [Leptopilina boulardi]|uniref:DNA-directed RNA polymerase III subunit RPC6 n=1 Tax=Leptopilina boulardi TaxID=63433 RepID=UPI0021F5EAC2|nr:DNA-directed RNA polymerase III subunit RPC6 [Leptopilina boulardi]